MNIRKQLSILLIVFACGIGVVALTASAVTILIRTEIRRLSSETTPAQVNLARLQQGFERASANFARIGVATTAEELSAVENDAEAVLRQIEGTVAELRKTRQGDLDRPLKVMRETHAQLREMATSRLEAKIQIAAANQTVAHELDQVVGLATGLSQNMETLQQDAQKSFFDAKKVSQDANAAIKATLIVREKTGQMQALLQEVRLVDKRYRLNVLRDKVAAVLDGLAHQDIPDPTLQGLLKNFTAKFGPAFEGSGGLLAARAAALQDPKDQPAFEEQANRLTQMVEELALKVTESVDPLEFSSAKANTAINRVAEMTAHVNTVLALSAGVSTQARAMQALAWQLIAARDERASDQTREQVRALHDRVGRSLASIATELRTLGRKDDLAEAAGVSASLARVVNALTGPGGVESVVKTNLRLQSKADELFSSALNTIKQIATDGSARSHEAENHQSSAVARIETLSTATIVIISIAGLLAGATGMWVGRRIRASILDGEEQRTRSLSTLRQIVRRVQESSHRLRQVSGILEETSEVVTQNVETAAAGAGQMKDSIATISERVAEAAAVGSQSATLLEEAVCSVDGLRQAGNGIGEVTRTIAGIARKTNILSLNAAIEAARAGKAGLGFEVVAGEVRVLANASTEATHVIGQSIESMKTQVNGAVDLINRISGYLTQIRFMQEEIAVAVTQQTASAADITTGIEHTAASCRGDAARPGVHALAVEISRLATDLESLCELNQSSGENSSTVTPAKPPAGKLKHAPPVRSSLRAGSRIKNRVAGAA